MIYSSRRCPPGPPDRTRRILEHGHALDIVGVDAVEVALIGKVVQYDQRCGLGKDRAAPPDEYRIGRSGTAVEDHARHDVFKAVDHIGAYTAVEQAAVHDLKTPRGPLPRYLLVARANDHLFDGQRGVGGVFDLSSGLPGGSPDVLSGLRRGMGKQTQET